MFCPHCGKIVPDGSRFCDGCGAAIGGAPVVGGAPVPVETPVETPAATPAATPKQSNGMAIAGFILAFFSPLLGWIFGGIGLSQSKTKGGAGKKLAIAAIVIATINFILGIILSFSVLPAIMEQMGNLYT